MLYRVQAGDTLSYLSQRFGVSVEAILAANSLPDPDVLFVGQELVIPEEESPDPRVDTSKVIVVRGVVLEDGVGLESRAKAWRRISA